MQNKSRTTYSILNIVTGIGGYIINTILGLVCRMVFARTLATDYLGVNGLFSNILTMLSLAELGIGSAIVYALYKPLAVNDEEKIASLVKFYGKCYRIIGIVVALVGVLLIPFLKFIIKDAPDIKESLYLIYCLYLFNTAVTYFFSYRISLLQAAQKSFIVTGVNYIITIVESIIQIVILYTTHNYILYLIILIVGSLLNNIIVSYIAKKQYPCIVKKDIRPLTKEEKTPLFKNVKSLVIIRLSAMLVNNTDNIIISYFSGLATVGLASNYILLTGTLTSLLDQVFNGINASVGNHNALNSKEERYRLFKCINFANFWLFGFAAIGIVVTSSDIVALLFGDNYVLDMKIPLALAINFYVLGMQSAVWTYKNTLGLFKYGRYLLFLTAGINLGLSIWLGNLWGLFGIYIATVVARLLTNAWYDPYAVFKYGFGRKVTEYFVKYLFYALLVAGSGLACYWISGLFSFNPIVNLILKLAVCIVIPNSVFALVFFKTDEFAYFLNLVKRLIGKVKRKKNA